MVARTIMLIEELRNYNFYLMSANDLFIEVFRDDTMYIQYFSIYITTTVLMSDAFTITPDGVLANDYEMELFSYEPIDYWEVMAFYDDYVLNNTFDGYVLDFK